MNWILTIEQRTDFIELEEKLSGFGAELNHSASPIPLGDHEVAVRAQGPRDLGQKLLPDGIVLKVSPDSEMGYASC